MKKILAVFVIVTMLHSFAGCGNEKEEKYCSNCGEAISKNDSFCEHCGATVAESEDLQENSNDNTVSTNSDTNSDSENNESSKPTTGITNSIHRHSYKNKVTAATCTSKGYTTHTCYCGYSYVDSYVNAGHKFSNYKCTVCGQWDKENIYSFLKDMVLQKGSPSGDNMFYYIDEQDGDDETTKIEFCYNMSRKELSIYNLLQSGDSMMATTYIVIPEKMKNEYEYACGVYSLPDKKREFFCMGSVEASTYNTNIAIACEVYEGDTTMRTTVIELAKNMINTILDSCQDFYKKNNLGYTIKDMGFTSFN